MPQLAYGSCNAFTWFAFQQAADATERSHQPVVRAGRTMSDVRSRWYPARQLLTGQPEAPPPDTLSALAGDDYRWIKCAIEFQPQVRHKLCGRGHAPADACEGGDEGGDEADDEADADDESSAPSLASSS